MPQAKSSHTAGSTDPSPFPGYLTTADAAARSGLSPLTIAHYLTPKERDGLTYPPKLRGIKVASIWLVEEQSLFEYLASSPTPGPRPGSKRRTKRKGSRGKA